MDPVEFSKFFFHLSALADGTLRSNGNDLIVLRVFIVFADSIVVIQFIDGLLCDIAQKIQVSEIHDFYISGGFATGITWFFRMKKISSSVAAGT